MQINCTAMFTIARLKVMLITQRKVFIKHTTLFDKCKNKRKIMLNYQCCCVKNLMKHVKTNLKYSK